MPSTPTDPDAVIGIELAIARLLLAGTIVGIALLGVGVLLMAAVDINPNAAAFPPFDPSSIPADLVALRPEGYLWAGILVLIATPIARVIGELVAFSARRDRLMAAIAAGILVVIALSIAVAIAAAVA